MDSKDADFVAILEAVPVRPPDFDIDWYQTCPSLRDVASATGLSIFVAKLRLAQLQEINLAFGIHVDEFTRYYQEN